MARNEEKNFGRLNRLLLQNQKDEKLKKNPPRPKLDTLYTVDDIKKWLPSIKRDLDFNLKQSQVPCYPEHKIQEFKSNIDHLQGLYKAFIRKLKCLDPQLTSIPWNDRAYQSRKRHCIEDTSESDDITHQNLIEVENKKGKLDKEGLDESSKEKIKICENVKHSGNDGAKYKGDIETANEDMRSVKSTFIPIHTPILDNEYRIKNITEDGSGSLNSNVNLELQDQPLTFRESQDRPLTFRKLQDQPLTFKRKHTYFETTDNDGSSLIHRPFNDLPVKSMKGVYTKIPDSNTHHQSPLLSYPDSDSDSSDNKG